ncbi:MAG: molybdopterin biosynthesis protein [Haloferacaceae archaeon]
MDRKEFRDLAPPERAHEAVASLDLAPAPERVPLSDARGRVLAERIDASIDVPGFDRASVDGYAVRAADTFGADEADPAVFDRIGTVHAGEEPAVEVREGTCAEVSTGAVVPPGADAVVMVERTDEEDAAGDEDADGRVLVRTALAPGDGIMFAGADVAAGDRALGPGTRLTAREVGLLSALGVDEVPARGRPTVGIVSTGDELVRPGGDLDSARGEIHDVNSYAVAAAVEEAGGEPRLYPHAGDDYDEMERVLREAADECDLVCSSGSTSASAVDVVYRVIEDGGELLLHGVAIKPGKPMLIGRLAGAAYVGLPGYPVSALTVFRTFVAPAIREAAGLPEPTTATVRGRMAARERYAEGRRRLMPVGLVEPGPDERVPVTDGAKRDGGRGSAERDRDRGNVEPDGAGPTASGPLVYPVDKGSGATTSLVEADGVVEVPADVEYLAAGDPVEVRLFSPDVRPPALFGVGEDDPALSRLLDRVERPRYLPVGSREGLRRLRDGVPDVAVVAEPTSREVEAVDLGGWSREWGLVVPRDSGVDGLAALVDRDVRFVNRRTDSGLRAALDGAFDDLADERGTDRRDLTDAVRGYDLTLRAHESPARKVAAGEAEAGLGLRATVAKLDLGFVPLGTQRVRVRAAPVRADKPGVRALEGAVTGADDVLDDLPGYDR